MAKRDINMTEGPIFGKMVAYTLPVLATGILQLLYNFADSFVVSRFAEDGEQSLAAVGATGSICNLLVCMVLGLSVGASVVASQYIGAKNARAVSETVHTSITASVIFGLPIALIGFLLTSPLLSLMGTPDDIFSKAVLYMQIYFVGIPATMVYNYSSAILRAKGDTRFPLYVLIFSGLINVLLNLLFVIVFHMDVAGVAWATVVSQVLSAIAGIWRLHSLQDDCRLYFHRLRLHGDKLLRIIRIGLPAGIQSGVFGLSNVLLQSSVNSLGSTVVAANTAASTLDGFVYTAQNAVYHGTLAFVGQNVGARKLDRVKKVFSCSLLLVTLIWAIFGGVEILFGRQMLDFYLGGNEKVIEHAVLRLTMLAATYFLCGYMEVFTGVMRGIGSSLVPMIITVVGVCGLRLVWIYLIFPIPYFHNLQWLFASYPISWALTLAFQIVAYLIIMRRTREHMALTDVPLYVK
ncbi:MAG: MATE family efflux transporter [Clostridia bacterium]|nr:MATE family efflux transporter [Clostridia bacterium]